MNSNIIVLGDSITWGAFDEKGGWVERLKQFLNQKVIDSDWKLDYMVYNLGISGDNSEGLLSRIEHELIPRIDPNNELIILIAIGINDSQIIKNIYQNRVSLQKFKENLENIVTKALRHTHNIALVGLNQVDESKTNPTSWDINKAYLNEEISKYNEVIKETSVKNKIDFIDILEKFSLYSKDLLIDGLHPNSEGHELIYNLVKNYLLHKVHI